VASGRSSRLLLLFQVFVYDVEHALPDGALTVHPVHGFRQRLEVEPETVGAPLDPAYDDPGLLEHLHVPGDRRLGDPESGGRSADRRRTGRKPLYDSAPDRVRKGLERIVSNNANSIEREYSGAQPRVMRSGVPIGVSE
jgi:hypothetical protein